MPSIYTTDLPLLCESREPPAHAVDMAAFPVQPTAVRAHMHRGAKRANARRQGNEEPVIGQFQPCVAQGATAERIVVPVQGETLSKFVGAGIDPVAFENDRPVVCPADFDETPIAGE